MAISLIDHIKLYSLSNEEKFVNSLCLNNIVYARRHLSLASDLIRESILLIPLSLSHVVLAITEACPILGHLCGRIEKWYVERYCQRRLRASLIESCANGNLGHIKSLLGLHVSLNPIYYPEFDGSSPLITATAWNHTQVAMFLVEAGAPVNEPALNRDNNSALHYAVSRCNYALAQWLLDNGADADVTNGIDNNYTPLYEAVALTHSGQNLNDRLNLISLLAKATKNVEYKQAALRRAALHGIGQKANPEIAAQTYLALTNAGDRPTGPVPLTEETMAHCRAILENRVWERRKHATILWAALQQRFTPLS